MRRTMFLHRISSVVCLIDLFIKVAGCNLQPEFGYPQLLRTFLHDALNEPTRRIVLANIMRRVRIFLRAVILQE